MATEATNVAANPMRPATRSPVPATDRHHSASIPSIVPGPSAAGRKAAVKTTCSSTADAVATIPQASSFAMAIRRRWGSHVSRVTKVPARHSAPIIDAPPTTAPISRKNAATPRKESPLAGSCSSTSANGSPAAAWLADRWATIAVTTQPSDREDDEPANQAAGEAPPDLDAEHVHHQETSSSVGAR